MVSSFPDFSLSRHIMPSCLMSSSLFHRCPCTPRGTSLLSPAPSCDQFSHLLRSNPGRRGDEDGLFAGVHLFLPFVLACYASLGLYIKRCSQVALMFLRGWKSPMCGSVGCPHASNVRAYLTSLFFTCFVSSGERSQVECLKIIPD